MSKNCDGVEAKPKKSAASTVEAVDSAISDEGTKKKSSLETAFRGFVATPHVRLERYNITQYLNRHCRPVTHRKILKKRTEYDAVHSKRLSQKCLVSLQRDNLEKLKASFRSKTESVLSDQSVDSDSEASEMTDMTVKCGICDKVYNSEKKLLKHQEKKHIIYKTKKTKTPKRVSFSDHVIVHEVKEYHKCRKCPKIFEDYKVLKLHTKKWHKKRKCYICNYCTKSFADRMFFKLHIRMHCDVCGDLFMQKSKYLEHRRDVCRVYKTHKCKTCEESFYKIMDLKDHSYDHLDECYVCDICKDQFTSKCAIAHHFAFLHSKKRPKELYVMRKMGTERLYLCKFCDESSVDKDILEVHSLLLPDLSNKATTGYKDYYFCDQCMKKFDTETDMLQHKWTHFLKTSDNSQLRPKGILRREFKTNYNINDAIPDYFKPMVVLEKVEELHPKPIEYVDVDTTEDIVNGNILKKALAGPKSKKTLLSKHQFEVSLNPTLNDFIDVDITEGVIMIDTKGKPIVDPKSKKTLLSKHQCETCGKYFSTNYCLNRHVSTQHEDFDKLRCNVCEETFYWPSLLRSHKCIRLNHPEMPFDDARAEILFDNMAQQGFDDFNIDESDDYMNSVDFDIPAPVVELRECDSTFMTNSTPVEYNIPDKNGVTSSGLQLIMQEVPIEF